MITGTLQLQIIDPDGHIRLVTVDRTSLVVGRDPACDVHLNARNVSLRHARIEVMAERRQVTDLGSMNGTRLAGADLVANVATPWQAGQALQIQGFTLTLLPLAASVAPAPGTGLGAGLLLRAQQGLSGARRNLERMRRHRYAPVAATSVLCFGLGLWAGYGLGTLQASDGQRQAERPPLRLTVIPTWTPTSAGVGPAPVATLAPTITLVPVITPLKDANDAVRELSTRAPTRTPTPPAASQSFAPGALAAAAAIPTPAADVPARSREWDPRLTSLGVTVDEAQVAPGQLYWRLVKALWQDEAQSGGRHHIYVEALDEGGRRVEGATVRVDWNGASLRLTPEAKPADEYPINFDMHSAGHAYRVAVDGQASDAVGNLGMGTIEARNYVVHTSFLLTFQRTRK